jgi:hypothetical protein
LGIVRALYWRKAWSSVRIKMMFGLSGRVDRLRSEPPWADVNPVVAASPATASMAAPLSGILA